MKEIHKREEDQFRKLLKQEGLDETDTHMKVFEAFLDTENHVTVEELVISLDNSGMSISSEDVIRTLKLLVRYGFAEKKQFDSRKTYYEHRHPGFHHDHMICTQCNRIIEFSDDHLEQLQVQIAKKYGFRMLLHKMEIYGICSECGSEQDKLITLDTAKPGQHLVIRNYSGCNKSAMRLVNMGLRTGDRVEVITNTGKGQLVVAADFNRFIIGRGMATGIVVEKIDT